LASWRCSRTSGFFATSVPFPSPPTPLRTFLLGSYWNGFPSFGLPFCAYFFTCRIPLLSRFLFFRPFLKFRPGLTPPPLAPYDLPSVRLAAVFSSPLAFSFPSPPPLGLFCFSLAGTAFLPYSLSFTSGQIASRVDFMLLALACDAHFPKITLQPPDTSLSFLFSFPRHPALEIPLCELFCPPLVQSPSSERLFFNPVQRPVENLPDPPKTPEPTSHSFSGRL